MNIIYNDGKRTECQKEDEINVIRHTAAHILAQAVKRLYPQSSFAYGPATEKGFYYDIDFGDINISDADLPKIEQEMRKIIKENLQIQPFTLSRYEAIALMKKRNEPYKIEHIKDLVDTQSFSFYQQGEYIDMCIGPHLTSTQGLKAFKLTGLSGAYWKNDKNNKMLTRINGTAFSSTQELDDFLKFLSEAERRDHRKIGKDMKLFKFEDYGPGFPFILPNGMIIKNELLKYWRELHTKNGYQEISTPLIMNRCLWETSGHWDHYKDNMYATRIDDEDYCIKPMNCPGGVLVYNDEPHSYRELPIRLAEIGVVHRHELKGTLHGLFRVRNFTQDDAHIFMRRDQIASEIGGVIKLINEIYSKFGFEYYLELSTRPENSMGNAKDWEAATNGLKDALEKLHLPYKINPGDGAFYGPKIDFHLRDCLGRTWQCGTIQLDFQMPLNFNLSYVDENDNRIRPIMIHRVCFGSIERFIGILTEHYAGKFPVWLSPIQAKILLVSKKGEDYAMDLYQRLQEFHIRCELDNRNEKIGYMIRQAQYTERVPYMIIIGEKELESNTISVRTRDSKTVSMTSDEFLSKIITEIKDRV
ncbi:MAG TPA: threonine--tRNA ligase [Methanocorpusculum sp.]|nr:threonine--tRNA ligase [Methanocorpusculum sp.]